MSYDWIIFLVFIAIILILERKKFKREGIAFLRRTDKGIKTLTNLSKKYEKYLQPILDFAIVLSIGILALKEVKNKKQYLLYMLISYVLFIKAGMVEEGLKSVFQGLEIPKGLIIMVYVLSFILGISGYGLGLLLGGSLALILAKVKNMAVTSSPLQLVLPISVPAKYNLPIFTVPFDKWILSLLIIVSVHELAHAIAALSNKIKVKSLGYGVFAFLPVGFAEPDERSLKKASRLKKLRVYAAGSFSNFLTALFFGGLFFLLSYGLSTLNIYEFEGISYGYVFNSTYAYNTLPPNGTITAIDNHSINNLTFFIECLSHKKPNETIILTINNDTYKVKLSEHPENKSKGFIGIGNIIANYDLKSSIKNNLFIYIPLLVLLYIIDLFKWIFLLNIGIGIANLLPLYPFDGGLMYKEFFKNETVFKIFNIFVLFLFLFSLFGKYIII